MADFSNEFRSVIVTECSDTCSVTSLSLAVSPTCRGALGSPVGEAAGPGGSRSCARRQWLPSCPCSFAPRCAAPPFSLPSSSARWVSAIAARRPSIPLGFCWKRFVTKHRGGERRAGLRGEQGEARDEEMPRNTLNFQQVQALPLVLRVL